MVFIETPIFARRMRQFLSENQYRALQEQLRKRPEAGTKVRGAGGIRKLRWNLPGQGKSIVTRVIYYWVDAQGRIFMLYAYPRSKQDDLSSEQLKALKETAEKELS